MTSIHARISQIVLILAGLSGLGMLLILGGVLHRSVDTVMDEGLQESAELLYGLMAAHPERLDAVDGILPAPPHKEGVVWQVVDNHGSTRLRSHQAPTIPLSSQSAKGFSDQPRWRVYSMQLGQGGGVLHVAQRAGDRSATQWQVLGSALGMMLIVGTTLVMWLNRRLRSELKPLQDLSEAVARFDPLATEVGLPDPTREELVPVIKAIHELGDRLASHVAHERALAAHSAHALRTPLAGIDAQLAVAIRQSEGPLQARLLQTRAAAARLQHVVSALINLFRSGGEMRWQQVSLAELVGNLPLKGAHVSVLSTEPIEADPDLLSAALFNLLDNSVRHQASEIEIRVELGDPFTVLSILDNGEGITSDRLEVVESALRGESTESGLGLGLAMTQLVARAHGGQVQIRARTDGRSGVEVLLSLQRHSLLAQGPGDRQP